MQEIKYFKIAEDKVSDIIDFSQLKEIIYGAEKDIAIIKTSQSESLYLTPITEEEFDQKKSALQTEESPEVKIFNLKSEYLPQIKDADLLGDTAEKERLQQEYLQKKAEIENA